MLAGPKTSSPSPMSFSSGIDIVASSANTEFRAAAPGPEKRGAGGRGRLGLPPYLDDGVPGLGSPSRSTGSNCRGGGGTLLYSEDVREGLHDRAGETRPLGEYGTYVVSGGGISGAESMIDAGRECCIDDTDGWYDLRAVYGLFGLWCKLDLSFKRFSSLDKGDLTGFRIDLLREGPSGIVGSKRVMSSSNDFCSLQVEMASSSSLRDARCLGVDI